MKNRILRRPRPDPLENGAIRGTVRERGMSCFQVFPADLQSLIEDGAPNAGAAPHLRQNPRVDLFKKSWDSGGDGGSDLQHIAVDADGTFRIRDGGAGVNAA